jgi:tripartite-type tricarboxylate transporter receptor subunit TctC
MSMLRRFVLSVFVLLATAMPGLAQDWPPKTVRIVVPFGPGSTPDIVARLIADGLIKKYPDSTFVVEYKPGASGNLGTDAVAKAPPDGATIGISIGGPLAINTLLFSKLPYDPRTDIAPITQLITQPSVLVVNPALKINTVTELIALLKSNPGKYNFSSIGNGSLSHLAMEAIAIKAGARLVHVPYPSSAAGNHRCISQRRADGLSTGDFSDASRNERRRENPRRLHRETFAISSKRSNPEGIQNRRGSRCLDGVDCAGRYAQAGHCQD